MQIPESQPVYLFAVRQILRLIKNNGIKPGQHLPPDIKLPALVGCSDHAVRGAMNLLARQGLLSRRRRHGTKILDLSLVPPGVWSVGITSRPAARGRHLSFESYLLHTIRVYLSENGVSDRTIIEQSDSFVMQRSDLQTLNPYLPMLLKEDLIQGVVTCRRAALADAPVLHVGAWELATWGVVIDTAAMVRQAMHKIYNKGIRHFAYVSHSRPGPGYNRGYLECINLAGVLSCQVQTVHSHSDTFSVEQAAREIADQLRLMSPRSRPKALLFVDDVLAFLVSHALASQPSYRPQVHAIVNDDTMITFPFETLVYSVDLDQMGKIAAREMISALGANTAPSRLTWIEPKEGQDMSHRSIMPYIVASTGRSNRRAGTAI